MSAATPITKGVSHSSSNRLNVWAIYRQIASTRDPSSMSESSLHHEGMSSGMRNFVIAVIAIVWALIMIWALLG